MSTINIDGFDLYYGVHGSGDPLVLVSGFASGSWLWFQQIEDLAKNFCVITFDPRGIANSKIDSKTPVSISDIANDIRKLLDELQLPKANVLGTSFGGFVALDFALRFPERLEKLILACTSYGGKNHILPKSVEALSAFATIADINSPERIRKFMIPAFTNEFAESSFDVIDKTCTLREQNEVPESVYMQQLLAATTFDMHTSVSQIEAETLIITGDSDLIVPMENSKNLADVIPNAQLKIIENGGHLFFIEQSAKFNDLVINFLK